MCGRYVVDVDREEMQKIVDAVNRALVGREEQKKVKVGEIYPTDIAPVCANTFKGITMTAMRWGFPGFPKAGSTAKPTVVINARSETVSQKPMFSTYLHQRCLVPANGYFEWVQNANLVSGKKTKYAFAPKENQSLFWMAGIYREIADAPVPVFTILTIDASESVAPIHNRMPVIFATRESQRAWLKGDNDWAELIRSAAFTDIFFQPAM